ncbi:STM3941 family protein [Microvirga sp. 0TCS3.31]
MHVVERSRAKAMASVLGCALFIVASLAIVAQGSAVTLLVGTAGIVTFAGFGTAWIVLLLRAGPGLVVDDTGFDDRSSATAVGRVQWADVTSVSRQVMFGVSFVVVDVRDPDTYLARLGPVARPAAAANRRLTGSPVTVTSVGLKISFPELSMLLRESFEQHHLT